MKILNLYAGKWARNYNECVVCSSRKCKHKGHGMCESCYDKKRDRTDEKSRKAQKKYRDNNRDKIRESQKKNHAKNRLELFKMFGNKCKRCGFKDVRALQIDHIHGGGIKERRDYNTKDYHRLVLKSLKNKENKYQLLCANCNWIKRHENQEWGGGKCVS